MEPLDMMTAFFTVGELQWNDVPLPGVERTSILSGMFLDDAVTDRETGPVPRPLALVVKNGSKMRGCVRGVCQRRYLRPRFDAAVMRRPCGLRAFAGGHGIASVQEKIQENLLQLIG